MCLRRCNVDVWLKVGGGADSSVFGGGELTRPTVVNEALGCQVTLGGPPALDACADNMNGQNAKQPKTSETEHATNREAQS